MKLVVLLSLPQEIALSLTDREKEACPMRPVPEIVMSEGFELFQRGLGWRGLCPLHDRDGRNPSFVAWETRWKCWSCGESGDGPAFIMKLKGMSFPQALGYLGEERERPTQKEKGKLAAERKERLKAEWRARDVVWTLGQLVRAGNMALRALTPENFDEYAGVVDAVATWSRWHGVFINGDGADKSALLQDLSDFEVHHRVRLFADDFNYRSWIGGVLR